MVHWSPLRRPLSPAPYVASLSLAFRPGSPGAAAAAAAAQRGFGRLVIRHLERRIP
eukprot:COSAG02_NODE_792_length_17157_cov_6.602122_15_plen_56_part_00